VFDEGHHLFDAADSTFAIALSGQEAIEMRRWIVGPEGKSRGRRRGLAARLMDVASYDDEGGAALEQAIEAARALPSDGWLGRIAEGAPFGPIEALLAEVRGTVYARSRAQDAGYGLETELAEPDGALVARPRRRSKRWNRCKSRCRCLRAGSKRCSRTRPTGSIRRRGHGSKARSTGLAGGARPCPPGAPCWRRIGGPADPDFVDWLAVDRVDGREYDVAVNRRWLDPTRRLPRSC
jgi:ATP-dependent DNA helicase DinG